MNDKFGINRHLQIVLCQNPDDAYAQGFNYNGWVPAPTPLNIDTAVIVHGGMKSGAATLDLIMVDANGKQHVTMITGGLLKSLALLMGDEPPAAIPPGAEASPEPKGTPTQTEIDLERSLIVSAYENGKVIEYRQNGDDQWIAAHKHASPLTAWDWDAYSYRFSQPNRPG